MTHPQDVPAPSPTVSEAMREAVAMILLHQLDVACHLAPGRCKGELEGLPEAVDALCAPAGPIASALAALERDSATLRASAERMEAALKPFASEANRYDPAEGDDLQPLWYVDRLRVGHLRAARAALTPKETPDA